MNIQDWFPLGWTGWISLQSKGLKNLLQHHSSKASIFLCSAFSMVQLSHPYTTTGKTIALTRRTFVSKAMSMLFNTLLRFVIEFLPRSKRLLILWLHHLQWFWSPRKYSLSLFPLFPCLNAMKWRDQMPWSQFTECSDLNQLFHSPFSPSSRGSLVPLHFLP